MSYSICLWLISLSIIFSGSIHVAANARTVFILWLSNIPFYVYNSFFIHSSVEGHFATINNNALYTSLPFFFLITFFFFFFFFLFFSVFFFSDIYLGLELLDHTVVLFLVFWGTFMLFSHSDCTNLIPTNSVRAYPFFHTLSHMLFIDIL